MYEARAEYHPPQGGTVQSPPQGGTVKRVERVSLDATDPDR
jgi:hypothetical protein